MFDFLDAINLFVFEVANRRELGRIALNLQWKPPTSKLNTARFLVTRESIN